MCVHVCVCASVFVYVFASPVCVCVCVHRSVCVGMCVCVCLRARVTYGTGHAARLLSRQFPAVHVCRAQLEVLLQELLIPPVKQNMTRHSV